MEFKVLPSFFFLILALGWPSCQPTSEEIAEDRALARVHSKSLMASDLSEISQGLSSSDSALMANAFVERWVREQALLAHAEKNMPRDIDIDELVRDYRASLIRHHYEKLIVGLELDSLVTDQQLIAEYEANESQFPLEEIIFKYDFLKMPRNHPKFGEIRGLWRSLNEGDTRAELGQLASSLDFENNLEGVAWGTTIEIENLLPVSASVSRMRIGRANEYSAEGDRFFVRLTERRNEGENAPLPVIESQLKRTILHKRKVDLIDSKIEEIYQQESKLNNVKIF
ncbi:MAG: hypothetical protein HKN16_07930 [Saprospiraceae bacterium]|nr:hypothetical protein [Saprospiraceae bacterium]